MSLDGATLEVIRSHLVSAAEEMRRTLIRTAFNPVIYEVLDFGISLYDADLELIADAPGLAFFLGANDHALVKGMDYVGRDNVAPGDIFVMNYPYWNSAHAMDATLFAPVFAPGADRPFAYTCIRAHWIDLGAKDPGYVLDSTDMHQEGMIFPGTRVYRGGEPVREIFELIRFNSRMPDIVIGDLEAQIAATQTGIKRLNAIYAKFGGNAFAEAVARIKEHGEAVARKALAALPHGSWEAEDLIDDDGISDDPVPMHVRVTIDDDGLTCDFSKSSPAVLGPINVPIGLTETICKFVLKSITTPNSHNNAGTFRPLKVVAPEGWDEGAPSSMRVASFAIKGADGATADVSVIPLPGNSGSVLDNVNRWRGQIHLPPLSSADDPALGTEMDGKAGKLIVTHMVSEGAVLDGTKAAISAAILKANGITWFFKMTGEAALVTAQREAFEEFVRSATFP